MVFYLHIKYNFMRLNEYVHFRFIITIYLALKLLNNAPFLTLHSLKKISNLLNALHKTTNSKLKGYDYTLPKRASVKHG